MVLKAKLECKTREIERLGFRGISADDTRLLNSFSGRGVRGFADLSSVHSFCLTQTYRGCRVVFAVPTSLHEPFAIGMEPVLFFHLKRSISYFLDNCERVREGYQTGVLEN